MADSVEVSVIVPVFNSEQTIDACLNSLVALEHASLEIIVVDDGSSDSSLALARRYETNYARVKMIAAPHSGPAASRNLGVRAAGGRFIFFTDSDVIAPPHWIRRVLAEFEAQGAAAVAGGVRPASLATRYEAAEDFRYWREFGHQPCYIPAAPTCNLAIRRSVLDEVGLFDETFKLPASEDFDLCYRLGLASHRIWFAPRAFIYHQHPTTLGPIVRRGLIQGQEHLRLMEKMGRRDLVALVPPLQNALQTGIDFLTYWLRDLPGWPAHLRWVLFSYDLAFVAGWCKAKVSRQSWRQSTNLGGGPNRG